MDREAIRDILDIMGISIYDKIDRILALQSLPERHAEELVEALKSAQELLFKHNITSDAFRKVDAVLAKIRKEQ